VRPRTAKTDAIAIRTIEVSNTSAIVVWMTRDHGRLATMIKGAYRPKSFFLGQFDLFYTCELVYYLQAREHLHSIRECYPIKPRTQLRSDWRACAAASYLCDLMARVMPWGAPHPETFRMLDGELDELAEQGLRWPGLFWFELKLLESLGISPRLDACTACSRKLERLEDGALFSDARGGLICSECARGMGNAGVPLSNGALGVLRGWQRAAEREIALRTRPNRRQSREVADLLGRFMVYHLEQELGSRETAFEIIGDGLCRERERR